MRKYKNYLFVGTGISLLTALILFYWIWQTPFSAWNLIPNNAMLVLETTHLPNAYKDLKKKTAWKNIQNAPYLATLQQKFQYFLQTVEQASAKANFWENKRVTLSLHWVGKENFDALFILPLATQPDNQIYQQFIATIQRNPNLVFSQRNLASLTITEVKEKETEQRFAFLVYRGFWVGSFSPLLLEDVVRKINMEESAYTFPQANMLKNMLKKSPINSTHTEVYLNFPRLAEAIGKLMPEHLQQELKHLGDWSPQTYLQQQANQTALSWKGYTFEHEKDTTKGLGFLREQVGKPFNMAHLIPQNTYLLYALNLDNPTVLAQNNAPLNALAKQLDGEIALAYLTNEGKDDGSLLFLKIARPAQLLKALGQEAITFGEREQVGDYAFQAIEHWDKLQKKLATPALNHFKQAYFAIMGAYIVISNDRYALRQYLQDYQAKKTWTYAPYYSKIVPTLKNNASFSVLAYPPLLWGRSYEWLTPTFQMLMGIYEKELKAMDWVIWQQKAGKPFMETSLQIISQNYTQEPPTEDTTKGNYAVKAQIIFGELLYTQPYLVKNFETQATEILIQDFRHNLFLVSEKGQVLWRRNMGAPMIGAPAQIDVYNNNRLQYVWAAGNRLHLIDKLGRNVPAFPVSMTDSTGVLQGIAVLDAQHNKNYLFASADERGRLFVLNKSVQWVANWSPKRLTYRLGTPIQAVRIKEANYYIALQENGQINAFKATGEPLAGFPLTVKQRFTTQMHIEAGATLATTHITTVSEEGKLIQFDLAGKLLKADQLHRPSGKARFALLQDEAKENYWFTVSADACWQLMDKNGRKLIEDEILNGSGKWDLQVFEPTPKHFVLAVTNKSEAKTALYDMRGKLLGAPFQSNAPIALRYDDKNKELLIYRIIGNKLTILAMKGER